MDYDPECKYRKIKTGLRVVDVISNFGQCSFIGLITISLLIAALCIVAPPFVNTTSSINTIINKGDMMLENANRTLVKVDKVINYHDEKINELEIKINATIYEANILLDKAMIDANKTEIILDKILVILQKFDFWPLNELLEKELNKKN
jgi:hypothetical protein